MYVLDTSAILAGVALPPSVVVIPPSVYDEVHYKSPEIKMYEIVSPGDDFVSRVVKASKKTGDYDVLSRTDMDVLALALQVGGVIITDDYAIQNVAHFLGIKYEIAEMSGIKEARKWKWRCESCGRYYRRKYESCPVCGGRLRRVRDR